MNWKTILTALLYPPKCPFCGRVVEVEGHAPCASCRHTLPWVGGTALPRRLEGCEVCLSPLWYREGVVEGMHRYKFRQARLYAAPFGRLMAQSLREGWQGPVHRITWAPLSAKGLEKRGYDQARLLAERVGLELDLPVSPTLVKTRHTKTQSRLRDPNQRRDNVAGAYTCLPGTALDGETVVLVDDVVTSGSTLEVCAGLLRQAGAAKVVALTLARAAEN